MAQPPTYNRQYSFQNYQASSPSDPLPSAQVDLELNTIKQTLDAILQNLALIQRDDTELANLSVGFDQFKAEISVGLNAPTAWATTTQYAARDTVFEAQKFYICATSHVSGTFSTDLSSGLWNELADFSSVVGASAISNTPAGSIGATDVQGAINELDDEKAALVGAAFTGPITTSSTVDGRDVATDGSKLDGVSVGATDDQSGAEIKAAYEVEVNAYDDTKNTKLGGVATGAEVNPAVVSQADAEAGTATDERIWTAERVKQAIAALETAGASTEIVAWVNFNGTGTVAINDSYNVSSITDNGTGDYTVNFSSALASADYGVQVTGLGVGSANPTAHAVLGGTQATGPDQKTTTAVDVHSGFTGVATMADQADISVSVVL